jgi:hypothetical protein
MTSASSSRSDQLLVSECVNASRQSCETLVAEIPDLRASRAFGSYGENRRCPKQPNLFHFGVMT